METKHCLMKEGVKMGFEIAKLTFKAATVVAAFMTVCELHRLHKGFEARHTAK